MKVLVLSGGSGSRLWPVSREAFPKQFMMLADGSSLLNNTFKRAAAVPHISEIITVTNKEYFFLVEEEYKKEQREVEHTYFLEPFGKNTAAPIALVALYMQLQGIDEELLVLPSDHVIANPSEFNRKLALSLPLVNQGEIVTFGIKPDAPKTGYGYIHNQS